MMATSSSVVVVSYRPGAWLADCVTSVLSQADQVVVVDNGSADGEAGAVARPLGAEVVRSAVNLGFAGGVDLGLRHARGELIGILNDDAVAAPGWLDAARSVLADPTVAAVTPKVVLDAAFAEVVLDDEVWWAPGDHRPLGRQLRSVTADGVEVLEDLRGAGVHDTEYAAGVGDTGYTAGVGDTGHGAGGPPCWRWTSGPRPFYVPVAGPGSAAEITVNGQPVAVRSVCTLVNHAGSYLERHGVAGEYGLGAPDDGRFDAPAERFGFSATAPVFRAATVQALGGFAPQFFAYNEDTDWCLRARLAGLHVRYDPGATVRHRLSATSRGPRSPLVRFLAQRNAVLCLVRNAPADVAREHVRRCLAPGSDAGVRRAVATKLPWAVASRLRLRRTWTTSPRRVWDRWAGADATWDDSPARTARR